MIAYLKCVGANKFTLASYLLFALGCVLMFLGPLATSIFGGLLVVIGVILGILTEFGLETLAAYKRVRAGLEHYGSDYFSRADVYYAWYCGHVGARLAIQEFRSTQSRS